MFGLTMQLGLRAAQFADKVVGVQTGFSLITLLGSADPGRYPGAGHLSATDRAHDFFSIERASLVVTRIGGEL